MSIVAVARQARSQLDLFGHPPTYLEGDCWTITIWELGGIRFHRVEIRASYENVEEWTAAFWAAFEPSPGEPRLRRLVEDPGIWINIDFPFRPASNLRDRYGPSVLPRVRRKEQRPGGLYVETYPDGGVRATLDDADYTDWEEQRQAAYLELCDRRLPEAPGEYYWVEDRGGIRLGPRWRENVWIEELTFRLWLKELGRMPVSE